MEWIKKNKIEFIIVIGIILLALFLRFYRLDEYMTFLGDEGRDALVIKNILVNFDLPLLGPPTSVGNMYLGPLYYYMMAVPMAIFGMNPVAAAGMVALIGTLTVGLIYYLSREWFGKVSAICAALLYAVSPVTVIYSKSSWNPNPAPFFALLSFLGLYKSYKSGNFLWFILTGLSLAFVVQMHYLALILLPIIGLLWLIEFKSYIKKRNLRKNFIKGTIGAVLSFLFLMSPLLIFDLRYNFMNYRAITRFFFDNPDKNVGFNFLGNFTRAGEIYQIKLIGSYMTADNLVLSLILALGIIVCMFWLIFQKFYRGKVLSWQYRAMFVWIFLGCLGLSFYHQEIYDHYLGFLNPAPYILFGALYLVISQIERKSWKIAGKLIFGTLFFALLVVNLLDSPLLKEPNRQLQRTQEVAKFVIRETSDKPFNFALIAEHNYDAAYQFYLEQYGHKPGKLPFVKTDQLIVVCEDPICEPVGHSKQEIAAFGWTVIEREFDVSGVKVYKLIPNPDQPK